MARRAVLAHAVDGVFDRRLRRPGQCRPIDRGNVLHGHRPAAEAKTSKHPGAYGAKRADNRWDRDQRCGKNHRERAPGSAAQQPPHKQQTGIAPDQNPIQVEHNGGRHRRPSPGSEGLRNLPWDAQIDRDAPAPPPAPPGPQSTTYENVVVSPSLETAQRGARRDGIHPECHPAAVSRCRRTAPNVALRLQHGNQRGGGLESSNDVAARERTCTPPADDRSQRPSRYRPGRPGLPRPAPARCAVDVGLP